MSKFGNIQDALKHFEETSGGDRNEFFTLKDDKDTAVVRFLHEGENDLDWYIAHEVEIQGKKRWVQCLENGCPACEAGKRPALKLFLQLIDKRDGKTKTWERGQKFIPKIISLINRYGNLCDRPFEIERLGKKGDTKTDYQIYPLDPDGKRLSDLPERQQLLAENGFILKKTASEVREIINGTYTPPNNNNDSGSDQRQSEQRQEPERRQTETKSGSDYF